MVYSDLQALLRYDTITFMQIAVLYENEIHKYKQRKTGEIAKRKAED